MTYSFTELTQGAELYEHTRNISDSVVARCRALYVCFLRLLLSNLLEKDSFYPNLSRKKPRLGDVEKLTQPADVFNIQVSCG